MIKDGLLVFWRGMSRFWKSIMPPSDGWWGLASGNWLGYIRRRPEMKPCIGIHLQEHEVSSTGRQSDPSIFNVLRRISGPKREEVTGGWRKVHNAELHNFYA
jgi:hypothetical protein